jgi:hypothetical protein
MDQLTHCRLQKGDVVHMAWIPTEHAHPGTRLFLKIGNVLQKWDAGWEVIEAFENKSIEQLRKYNKRRKNPHLKV